MNQNPTQNLTSIKKNRLVKALVLSSPLLFSPCFSYASTASQVLPAKYSPNQYCTANTTQNPSLNRDKAPQAGKIEAIIPQGTAHPQLVGDISCINQRLEPYQQATQPVHIRYQAYKARAWLTYISHEDNEQSLTAAGHFALNEALSILTALETHQADKLPINGDIPTTSGLKRPDLWAKVLTIKQTPAFEVLPKEIAFSEVKLIWAEAEFCEFGWRHSREHYAAAERWVDAAEITALNHPKVEKGDYKKLSQAYYATLTPLMAQDKACHGAVLPRIALPTPVPIMPPAIIAPTVFKPYVVHFALDKSALTPDSQAILTDMLNTIRANQNASNLNIGELTFDLYGFTDKRASADYNLALSKKRTNAVKAFLLSQGLSESQLVEHPKGMANQKQSETDINAHALSRRVEVYLSKNGVSLTDKSVTESEMNKISYNDLKLEK